jgi:hypothetical protein
MPASRAPDWPDVTERDRWTAALADAAHRVERDRGVVETWWLEARDGALWACYGGVVVRAAGEAADVSGAEELFEEIDTWVAFERPAGPGRVLERDLQAMAEWRAQLAVQQPRYEAAAATVFLDIAATTSIDLGWRVAVHEEEFDLSSPPPWVPAGSSTAVDPPGAGVVGHELAGPGPWPAQPPTRSAPFPQIHLETRASSGRGSADHLGGADDLDDAVLDVAGTVQDLVIEEVHGAWPVCPGHWHPMAPGSTTAGPVWRCPDDQGVAVPIGHLVELTLSRDEVPDRSATGLVARRRQLPPVDPEELLRDIDETSDPGL